MRALMDAAVARAAAELRSVDGSAGAGEAAGAGEPSAAAASSSLDTARQLPLMSRTKSRRPLAIQIFPVAVLTATADTRSGSDRPVGEKENTRWEAETLAEKKETRCPMHCR